MHKLFATFLATLGFASAVKADSSTQYPEPKPRGILPFVGGGCVTIRKAAPHVQNTYEVRLGLFMAVQHEHLPFVLAVPPGAIVAEDLRAKLNEFGGTIVEESPREFTIYVGAKSREGQEMDGWVLGDQDKFSQLVAAFGGRWPGPALIPGATFVGEQLVALRAAVSQTTLQLANVDDEDVKGVLLALIQHAHASGGTVYLQ